MDAITLDLAAVASIIGSVLGAGLVLSIMAWRIAARQDRRIDSDRAESEANRRAFQASIEAFRDEMRVFERAMHRLAERQSHVEGRFDERRSAAD